MIRVATAVRRLSMAATPTVGPLETRMRQKLESSFEPVALTISNDSWQHRHHAAMRNAGVSGETHFSLQIVAAAFDGKTTMQRHRLVYTALSEELAGGLHSLSLKTKTPLEAESESIPDPRATLGQS